MRPSPACSARAWRLHWPHLPLTLELEQGGGGWCGKAGAPRPGPSVLPVGARAPAVKTLRWVAQPPAVPTAVSNHRAPELRGRAHGGQPVPHGARVHLTRGQRPAFVRGLELPGQRHHGAGRAGVASAQGAQSFPHETDATGRVRAGSGHMAGGTEHGEGVGGGGPVPEVPMCPVGPQGYRGHQACGDRGGGQRDPAVWPRSKGWARASTAARGLSLCSPCFQSYEEPSPEQWGPVRSATVNKLLSTGALPVGRFAMARKAAGSGAGGMALLVPSPVHARAHNPAH